jgi:hypothetical protein
MIASLHWGDLANYSTATAPVMALVAWIGRMLWVKIRHELTPNSGSSLRDAIDRIEHMVTETQHELEKHIAYHKGQESQQ